MYYSLRLTADTWNRAFQVVSLAVWLRVSSMPNLQTGL